MSNAFDIPSTVSTTDFRDLGDAISPAWLNAPVGKAYRYAMSVQYDALCDGFAYAVRARFPLIAPPDAFVWFAQDRLIIQGPNEPLPTYAVRLTQWLDLWRHAGSSMAIELALLAYFYPLAPQVATIKSAADGSLSEWLTYPVGSVPFPAGQTNPTPPTRYLAEPSNWDWDGASQPYYYPWMRWREWVVIQSNGSQAPWPAPTAVWGTAGQDWGGGLCWGWAGTAAQAQGLTEIAVQWKSAGTWVPWIVVCYDSTYFNETLGFGSSKLPNGNWGYYGEIVAGVMVSARPPASTCSFITGTNDGGGVLGLG